MPTANMNRSVSTGSVCRMALAGVALPLKLTLLLLVVGSSPERMAVGGEGACGSGVGGADGSSGAGVAGAGGTSAAGADRSADTGLAWRGVPIRTVWECSAGGGRSVKSETGSNGIAARAYEHDGERENCAGGIRVRSTAIPCGSRSAHPPSPGTPGEGSCRALCDRPEQG